MRIFYFAIFYSCFKLNAQQVNLDSLWGIWENQKLEDTIRLEALDIFVFDGYSRSNPDTAYYFAAIEYEFAASKGLKKYMAKALYSKGLTSILTGKLDLAKDHLIECLDIQKERGDQQGIATALSGLGNLERNKGNLEDALIYLEGGKKIYREIGDSLGLGSAISSIAVIYIFKGNYTQAIKDLHQSLEIREKINDEKGKGFVVSYLGILYYYLADYDKALEYMEASYMSDKKFNNLDGISSDLNNLGSINKILGNYDKALENYKESISICRQLNDKKGIATAMVNLGNISWQYQKDHETAITYLDSASVILRDLGYQRLIPNILNNMGNIYKHLGKNKEAVSLSTQAFEIADKLGLALEKRDAVRAMIENYKILEIKDSSIYYSQHLNDLYFNDIYINLPVLTEGEKENYLVTVQREIDLLFDLNGEYIDNQELCERSFNNAITIKGLMLRSSLALRNIILSSDNESLKKDYQDWISLKQSIAEKYAEGQEISNLEKRANEIEKQLINESKAFKEFEKVKDLDWRNIQKSLNENESAIEFIRYKKIVDFDQDAITVNYYAALLVNKKSERPEFIPLFEESELEKIMGSFPGNNVTYIEQVYGTNKNTKSQLYDLIWKPLENNLAEVKKVYISPVGLLHKISFAALSKGPETYLCDSYEIEMKTSTGKILDDVEIVFEPGTTTTIFGGIDYNSDSSSTEIWGYLDGSLSETKQIEKILKKGKRNYNYFSQSDATEEKFKEFSSQSSILHIATHGFFYMNPEEINERVETENIGESELVFRGGKSGMGYDAFVMNPNPLMRSGIVFAGANDVWSHQEKDGEDGVLTAQEVIDLDLRNTSLVVLSACETGLGDIKGSEGVYGLQRAFKMAGAKYMIMSLWQVPDKETAEFMTTFYKKLSSNKNIKLAFNETQNEMRMRYDPYFWAAFVLIE